MVAGKKSPVGRALAAILAAVLIGLMVFVTNSFTGNPISAYFAGQQMAKYVRQKYPEMTLNLSKAEYNFKDGGYTLQASSPDSPDTHFMVTRRRDGVIYDGYQDYVLGGFNTMDRLGREMTSEITPLLKSLFGDQLTGRCFADLFSKEKEPSQLPLDMPFQREMNMPATIYLDFSVKQPTLDDVAAKLQEADELLKREGFTVAGYIVEILDRTTKQGYAMQVDAELIDDQLAGALSNALDSNSYNEKLSVRSMR